MSRENPDISGLAHQAQTTTRTITGTFVKEMDPNVTY